MIIKKFQGKTEEEAMSAARREMGENVVLMSARSHKKKGLFSFLKKPMVEVTVGMEEESERQTSNAFSMLAKQSVNRGLFPTDKLLSDVPEETPPATDKTEKVIEQRLDSLQSLLEKQLKAAPEKDEFEKGAPEDSTVSFLKLI